MKDNFKKAVCPLCSKETTFQIIKHLKIYRCLSCLLLFQKQEKNGLYTPNESTWGKNDPRTTLATYNMKKQTFRILFKEIIHFLSNNRIQKINFQLLDIGTGIGTLLDVANEYNFKTIGLEPENKFAKIAMKKGLNIKNETLENTTIKQNSLDIITMFDVIEHMQNCTDSVKKVHSLLRKNGLFILSTPNIQSLSFRLLANNWPHYKKEHILYFSPKSIRKLLETNGFVVEKVTNSLKALSLEYIVGYFTVFKNPIFTPLSKVLITILPKVIREVPLNVPNGNMLVISRKI